MSILISFQQKLEVKVMSQYRRIVVSSRDSVTRNSRKGRTNEKTKQKVDDQFLNEFGVNKVNIVGSKGYNEEMISSIIFKSKEIGEKKKEQANDEQHGGFKLINHPLQSQREKKIIKSTKTEENSLILPEAVRPQSSKGRRPKTSRNLQTNKLSNMRKSFHQKLEEEGDHGPANRKKMVSTADNFHKARNKSICIQRKSAVDAQFLNLFAK